MTLRAVPAVVGLVELLFPRKLVQFMMDATRTEETDDEFKPWVYKLTRLEGLVFVLCAVW